ncbi:MAG TPA: hypothetical protein VFQ59_00630 [Candidatus Paceibacterota bacterium]|nr:hypothetical protein [Candidatus Paceibacterota bacterium]
MEKFSFKPKVPDEGEKKKGIGGKIMKVGRRLAVAAMVTGSVIGAQESNAEPLNEKAGTEEAIDSLKMDNEKIWEIAEGFGEGVVFQLGNKLYVLVKGSSKDMQIAVNKATMEGRVAFGKYLKTDTLKSSRAVKSSLAKKDGGIFEATTLMEMPTPEAK